MTATNNVESVNEEEPIVASIDDSYIIGNHIALWACIRQIAVHISIPFALNK